MVDFSHDIENCLEVLTKGGIILYPTDTIWGLGCDATSPVAVEKIYSLKQRPDKKALIILVSNESQLLQYIEEPAPRILNYLKQTLKPTTVIYEGGKGIAANIPAHDGTIAIRITKDPFCSQLIDRFDRPIVSTSANISGDAMAPIFSEIKDDIKNGVDYIVNYRRDDNQPGRPSSLVKFNADGSMAIIRP